MFWAIAMDRSQAQTIKKAVVFLGNELFNDWGVENVANVSPFWERTAQKQPLPGIYLTNSLVN